MTREPDPPTLNWLPAPAGWRTQALSVSLWCADVDRSAAEHPEEDTLLDEAERARAARLRTPLLQRRFVAAHAILRRILARALGREPAALRFRASRHGKPRLDPPEPLAFNVSRREALVLVALSTAGEVGVDVERVRALDDLDRIAADVFTPAERRLLASGAGSERERRFFAAWTRKEAVIKATGEGLSAPLQEIEIAASLNDSLQVRRTGVSGELALRPEWTVLDLEPAPGYAAALALPARPGGIERFRFP